MCSSCGCSPAGTLSWDSSATNGDTVTWQYWIRSNTTSTTTVTWDVNVVWDNWTDGTRVAEEVDEVQAWELEEAGYPREEARSPHSRRVVAHRLLARARARRLLFSILSEEQVARYRANRPIRIEGGDGRTYVLDPSRLPHNLYVMVDGVIDELCVYVDNYAHGEGTAGMMPREDNHLGQILWLMTDPAGLLRRANRRPAQLPGRWRPYLQGDGHDDRARNPDGATARDLAGAPA